MCQIPNIWHLAHQTPKTDHHEVSQMPKILAHCYSAVSNMRRYGQKWQNFILLLFYLLFLSPHHRFLSLSVLSSLSSLSSLFLFHSMPITKGHHSTLVLSTCSSPPPLTSRSPPPLSKDRLLYSLELASSTCQVARISFDTNVARLHQCHLLLAK